jgi:hypothetical protein
MSARGERFTVVGRGGSGGVGGQGRRRRETIIDLDEDGYPIVGNALYHSVGERADALASMKLDFDRLLDAITHKIGNYPGRPDNANVNPVWFKWYMAAVDPVWSAWREFYKKMSGEAVYKQGQTEEPGWRAAYIAYGERFSSDWQEFDAWLDRIKQVRYGAIALGILPSDFAAPAPLPTTLAEDIKDAAKKTAAGAGDALDALKWIAVAVAGVGVAYVVTEAVKGTGK